MLYFNDKLDFTQKWLIFSQQVTLIKHLCIMTSNFVYPATCMKDLENDLNSLNQRFAAERSFAMREHERDIAELITYDDMEFVTIQLEKESQQKITVRTC